MASYRDYLTSLAPWWLDQFNKNGRLLAYGDTLDSLYTDARNAALNSWLQSCDPSCLDALGANFNLNRLTGEKDEHFRKYLETAWQVWQKSGSDQGIIEALERAGLGNVRIVHWQDLMNQGIPTAFRGGYHTIPGVDANGGVRYVSILHDGIAVTQQVSPNSLLGLSALTYPPYTVTVTLQGDAAGHVLSTANQVARLFHNNPTAASIGVYCDTTGTGQSLAATGTVTLDYPIYTHFFIDIDQPNPFGTAEVWDGNPQSRQWNIVPSNTGANLRAITGQYNEYILVVGDGGFIGWWDGVLFQTATSSTTNNLHAISTAGAGVTIAVGDGGTIVGGGPLTWAAQTSGTTNNLYGCYIADINHAWAAGQSGTLLQYVTGTWSAVTFGGQPTTTYRAMWGISTTNVWAVGDTNTIVHYNGATWSVVTGPSGGGNLQGVWADSASDVWVCDDAGKLYYYNGTSWSLTLSTAPSGASHALFGFSSADVYSVGDSGKINQWVSGASSPLPTLNSGTNRALYGVWGGAGDQDLWAVGASGLVIRRTNDAFTTPQLTGGEPLNAVETNGTDAWAVGNTGRVAHYDGTTWSDDPSIPLYDSAIYGLWTSPTDTWAVGENGFIARNQGSFVIDRNYVTTENFYGVSGSSENDVWIVGSNGKIIHFDGTNYFDVQSPTSANLYAVVAYSPILAYAVGAGGTILRWDGGTWKPQQSPTTVDLYGVCAAGNLPIAVGDTGTIVRYTGLGIVWALMASPVVTNLRGISTTLGQPVWAVGDTGTLLELSGGSWNIVTPPTVADYKAVFSLAGGQTWAVGAGGTIITYNGTWAAQASGVTTSLYAISGPAAASIYAAGQVSPLLHFDGTSWSSFSLVQAKADLHSVFALAIDDVYITGDRGTLLHYDGTSWSAVFVGTNVDFTDGFAFSDDNIYLCGFYGGGGVVWQYNGVLWQNVLTVSGMSGGFSTLWGSGLGDLFAGGSVSGAGAIYHFDGTSWSSQTLPAGIASVVCVRGFDRTHVYASVTMTNGQAGMLFYNGATWQTFSPPPGIQTYYLTDLAITRATQFWACSVNGVLYFWDGTQWHIYVTQSQDIFSGVAVAKGVAPFVVGQIGAQGTGIILQLIPAADQNLWDDGELWDLNAESLSLLSDVIADIRKFKCAGTSCRFLRINLNGNWTTFPVGELAEIDIHGNYTTPQPNYLLNY